MKNLIKNYYWILMVLVFMLMLVLMHWIVDDPEQVGAAEDPYNIPQAVIDSAEKWGEAYGICPEFLEAIAWEEGRYKSNVSNKSGTCHGLMQINWSAHGDRMQRLGVTDIFNLDQNMHTAADYLRELFERYEDPARVLMEYHGETTAGAFCEACKMSSYASRILELSAELEELHGKKELERKSHFEPDLEWSEAKG